MGSFSLVHWIVVIVILLLVFGPKRLSEVGKGLGQGIRNFKKGMEGDGSEGGGEEDADEKPKRVKDAGERSPKKLKAKRAEPVEEDDGDDEADEEEEARPRKKSKRA